MKIVERIITLENEDEVLHNIDRDVNYAIIYTQGHNFVNKQVFIEEIYKLMPFFLAGHILDCEKKYDGYYCLHEQCYVLNMQVYNTIGQPSIGNYVNNSFHSQVSPIRSLENFHDDYTPMWVKPGSIVKSYKNKMHGWNILSEAFKNNLTVLVFNELIRCSKTYQYKSK